VIRLKFEAMQDPHSITVGPAQGFRVAGNFMRQLPEEQVIGEYVRHQWCVQDRYFSRYDALDPCRVYFSDVEGTPTRIFGPFDDLFVADGTMYFGGQLFAKFNDETLAWHSFMLETYWPNLVITGADNS
jgi:hypothetical protein